jgi:hypothetical protein
MGQAESAGDVSSPVTPPEVEISRRREDYLQRLGINKQNNQNQGAWRRPQETAEAPDRLQHDRLQATDDEEDLDEGAGAQSMSFSMDILRPGSQDDFRTNYLKKLSYMKVWVPQAQRPPKHQTVIIFDWDDTLLCTSYLNFRGDADLQPSVVRHLDDIQRAGKKLLELAMGLGRTFIITNAMNGWVQYSAAKWIPEVLDVLQNQRVRVISARANHEPQYPGEVGQWKIQAFLEEQRALNSDIITNLISLGDSNFEMDAVHVMGREFSQALVKTIKFRENPSPEELLKELELVTEKFERIVENARPLKIGLERRRVGGAQQG